MENKEIENELIDKYGLKPDEEYDDGLNKKKEVILCQLLVEAMEEEGAPQEELFDIITYMMVVINAKKNKLDWKRAYEDLRIDYFVEKYVLSKEEKGENENEE